MVHRNSTTLSMYTMGCVFLVLSISTASLLGSFSGMDVLASVHPEFTGQKPNTAFVFILLALCVGFSTTKFSYDSLGRGVLKAVYGFAFMFSLATLWVHFLVPGDLAHSILTLFTPHSHADSEHCLICPLTAVCFLLLSLALFLFSFNKQLLEQIAETLTAAVLAFSILSLIGNFFNVKELYNVPYYAVNSLPPAVNLVTLSTGIFAMHGRRGFLCILTSKTAGGRFARTSLVCLPAVILLAGYICTYGETHGWFDHHVGEIFLTSLSIIFTAAFIVFLTWSLDQLDSEKKEANFKLYKQQEVNSWQEDFNAFVAHEFRTPLNNISSAVQLLRFKEKKRKSEDLVTHLDRIQSDIENMSGLLSNFLSGSKAKDGEIRLNIEKVTLFSFIDELVAHYRNVYPYYSFNVDLPPRDCVLEADHRILKIALSNILSNAVKYSDSADGEITVSCQCAGNVNVDITDCGIGIAESDRTHLFEKFYRGSRQNDYKGSGIGLYMTRRIVKAHHGRIRVDSQEGEGTTFSISLPYRQPKPAANDVAKEAA